MNDQNNKVAQYLESSEHLKIYYQKRAITRLINNSIAAAEWTGQLSPQFENNIRAFILASVFIGSTITSTSNIDNSHRRQHQQLQQKVWKIMATLREMFDVQAQNIANEIVKHLARQYNMHRMLTIQDKILIFEVFAASTDITSMSVNDLYELRRKFAIAFLNHDVQMFELLQQHS